MIGYCFFSRQGHFFRLDFMQSLSRLTGCNSPFNDVLLQKRSWTKENLLFLQCCKTDCWKWVKSIFLAIFFSCFIWLRMLSQVLSWDSLHPNSETWVCDEEVVWCSFRYYIRFQLHEGSSKHFGQFKTKKYLCCSFLSQQSPNEQDNKKA